MRRDEEDLPVIDPWMLYRFQEELGYLHHAAQTFGEEHPNAAAALRISRNKIHDPYVNYLLEGVAFLAARVRLKLDDEFPRFVEHMLDIVAPQLLATTPSMAVVAFEPNVLDRSLVEGRTIPIRTQLTASSPADAGSQVPDCIFTTGRDVVLTPLRVVSARYIANRAELGPYMERMPQDQMAAAGLQLTFEVPDKVRLCDLNLDHLDVYLSDERGGAGDQGKRLFDALCGRCVGGVIVEADRSLEKSGSRLPAPSPIGFRDPSMLVGPALDTSGHRYLQEYFACPERFQFARLEGLKRALAGMSGQRFEVTYLLEQEEPRLFNAVSERNFVLHATPVINLFERETRPVDLSRSSIEHRVTVEGSRPFAFEIVKLQAARVWKDGPAHDRRNAYPIYEVGSRADEWGTALYFQQRRETSRPSSDYRIVAGMADSDYEGADVFVSFCNLDGVDGGGGWTFAAFKAWCCNRDHPLRIARGGGAYDMSMDDDAPVTGLKIVRPPTPPRNPMRYMTRRGGDGLRHTRGEWYWRALNHLSANYQSLIDAADGRPDGLKEALAVYAFLDDAAAQQAIRAIRRVRDRAIVRRLQLEQPVKGRFEPDYARAYPVRGRRVIIVMDEKRLGDGGVFLLGGVVSRFLAEFASVNSFIELEIRDSAGNEIGSWPAQAGERRLA